MVKSWPVVRSEPLGDFRIFNLRADICTSPLTGREHDFFIIDCVNWVNVIALTPDDQLVMVEQYRFGSRTVELEIPGGMMDPGENDPVATAVRELREETGYEGDQAQIIGKILPNPAVQTNTCFTILVENCRRKHALKFDQTEDLATRLVPTKEILGLVAAGKIQHSLVAVALFHYDLRRRGVQPAG